MKTWFKVMIGLCLVIQLSLLLSPTIRHVVTLVCSAVFAISLMGMPFGGLLPWSIVDLEDDHLPRLEESYQIKRNRITSLITVIFFSIPSFAGLMLAVRFGIKCLIWFFHLRIISVG